MEDPKQDGFLPPSVKQTRSSESGRIRVDKEDDEEGACLSRGSVTE